jgi:hypothetical protein
MSKVFSAFAILFLVVLGLAMFITIQQGKPEPPPAQAPINVEVQPPNIEIQNQLPKVAPTVPAPDKKKGQVRVWPFVKIEWEKK